MDVAQLAVVGRGPEFRLRGELVAGPHHAHEQEFTAVSAFPPDVRMRRNH